MKQLRIDFPDYSAREQERDAMKSRFHQVYLMKIDGNWGHYTLVDGKENIDFHDGKDLSETYFDLKAQFPQHQVKVIQNKGLEDYLRDKRPQIMKKRYSHPDNVTELSIKFERNDYDY